MPRLHAEALLFSLAWAALALAAGFASGWRVGALMSVGLMLIIMPVSSLIVTRTDNFVLERGVRWTILGLAAAVYLFWSTA